MKTHVVYFASFIVVSSLHLTIDLYPTFFTSDSLTPQIIYSWCGIGHTFRRTARCWGEKGGRQPSRWNRCSDVDRLSCGARTSGAAVTV
ncbi:uncharacterized protein HD556DRAFT_1360558, partial [Suillus plorans]